MTEPDDLLRSALAELAARSQAGDPHPATEELAAYQAGELPAAAEARVQDHLAVCRECTALLLDLDDIGRTAAGDPVPPVGVETAWAGLVERLPREEPVPSPRPLPRPSAPPRRWLPAAAAALLALSVGLSLWAARLQRTVEELSRPQLNAPVTDLRPGPVRQGGEGPAVVELAPGSLSFTLLLNPPSAVGVEEDHGIEIVRPDGTLVWRGQGLRPNAFGSFSLTLSRRFLAGREYRIRLLGPGDGAAIAEYPVKIVPSSEGR